MIVETPARRRSSSASALRLVGDLDPVVGWCVDAGALDVGVDRPAEALVEEAVGAGEVEGEVVGEGQDLTVGAGQAPGERHPVRRVPAQVRVVPASVAGEGGHGAEPEAGIGQLVGRRQGHAVGGAVAHQLDEPAEEVAARDSDGAPGRRTRPRRTRSRPAAKSSSASWRPVCPDPTTSTAPAGSAASLR